MSLRTFFSSCFVCKCMLDVSKNRKLSEYQEFSYLFCCCCCLLSQFQFVIIVVHRHSQLQFVIVVVHCRRSSRRSSSSIVMLYCHRHHFICHFDGNRNVLVDYIVHFSYNIRLYVTTYLFLIVFCLQMYIVFLCVVRCNQKQKVIRILSSLSQLFVVC